MSMTCLPTHGKLEISPGEPSAFRWIGLIQPRPSSPAKKWLSSSAGNLVGEFRLGSKW
jgi:hypothetical protein